MSIVIEVIAMKLNNTTNSLKLIIRKVLESISSKLVYI